MSFLNFLRLSRSLLRLGALTALALPSESLAQAPSQVNEDDFATVPIDFELTSDASRAVVRGVDQSPPINNADVITVWETAGGTQLIGSTPTGFCSSAMLATASSFPSDAVRVVGGKAVLIANDV